MPFHGGVFCFLIHAILPVKEIILLSMLQELENEKWKINLYQHGRVDIDHRAPNGLYATEDGDS
jgi:hypothetical protein